MMADFGWDASDISGFALEDERVTAGVDLGKAIIPWASFGQQMQAMREASERPAPSEEEIEALEQIPTTWEIGQAPATWVEDDSGELDLGYVAVVHGPTIARGVRVRAGSPFDAGQLSKLVGKAAGMPRPRPSSRTWPRASPGFTTRFPRRPFGRGTRASGTIGPAAATPHREWPTLRLSDSPPS